MKNLHRVVWSKGMFLTPQHFQTQDEYLENLFQFRFAASQFANWGVTELNVDEPSLLNGLFTLRYCRGILPDGLVFNIPETDQLPPGRAVEEFFPPLQKTLDVYLAVPEQRAGGRNFTLLSGKQLQENASRANTRYVAETRMMQDENLGAEEKPVQVAKKNFALLLEGENLDGFTSLRIAQITRNQAGAYILNPQFVAPCLNIGSSEYLMMLVRRQIEVLLAKSSSLAAPRQEKGRGLRDFTTSEVSSYWLLHTVNSYMPELKHIWKVRRGHPEPLFLAMLRLAGALSTFALDASARDLPDYDHNNLGSCFTELDGKIRALIDTILPEPCLPIPLQSTDKLIWSGTVPDDQYFKNSQFFLSISARMGVDELISKFPTRAKLSSPADIQRLIRNSLPGLALRHEPAPPPGIPRALDNQYFRLNQSGALWEAIEQSRNICVFVPSEIVEPKMELLILLE
jgi:type VI secretion system protein ImpJ